VVRYFREPPKILINYKKWKAGEPFEYPMPKGDGKHWERLLEPAMDAVKIRCAAWKDEIQNLLIFVRDETRTIGMSVISNDATRRVFSPAYCLHFWFNHTRAYSRIPTIL